MSERRTVNGAWVVIGLLALGVIAGVAGRFTRKVPRAGGGLTAPSATTQAAVESGR
jgi:amino acid transporter